ncbi:MAG: hypothetical protein FJX65_00535 [Alphaproteobacteria bacterium]|nr:hypothetical protein [Alphaproteobacteria bacterium]
MDHRTYRGRITRHHDDFGETGREWVAVSIGAGQRTLRAVCELDRDRILRDCVQSVDDAWRPLDAYVRLTVRGAYMGSAWFQCRGDVVECEAVTVAEGRVRQSLRSTDPLSVFVTHALTGDGWQTVMFDRSKDERIQVVTGAASSPNPLGDSGPMAGLSHKRIEYAGEERVTVPAGTFATRHYRILSSLPGRTPLLVWVTGEDTQLVKMRWDLTRTTYVLDRLEGELR